MDFTISLTDEQKLGILRNYRRLIKAVFPEAHKDRLNQMTWDYATSRKIELEEIWDMSSEDSEESLLAGHQ